MTCQGYGSCGDIGTAVHLHSAGVLPYSGLDVFHLGAVAIGLVLLGLVLRLIWRDDAATSIRDSLWERDS